MSPFIFLPSGLHISNIFHSKKISNRPFSNFRNKQTLAGYCSEPFRLLTFLLQDKKNYALPLPPTTAALIAALKSLTVHSTLASYVEAIHNLLLNLWTTDWVKYALASNSITADPTMHCVILSSIRASGWARACMVTNTLAKYTFAIRAVMLREAHRKASLSNVDVRTALDALQRWYTEKQQDSTFNDLRSAQHLVSAFSFSQKQSILPKIVWTGGAAQLPTKGTFVGQEFRVKSVPLLSWSVIAEACRVLKEEVFLGLNLRAQYGYIADDLSNSSPNYFFLADPRNAALCSHGDALMGGILNDPALSQQFAIGRHPVTREPIWNHKRLRQWYMQYCRFNALVAVLITIGAGSPCRGTELTSIQYRNTPCRRRGLYYFDRRLVVATQYSKTSSLSGKETMTPHALDALTTDMLLQRIIIADQFAQSIACISLSNQPQILELLQSHLFVNFDRPFSTASLSQALSYFTHRCFGIPMGFRRWRHFSIALRRKFCPEFDVLAATDGVQSLGALQAGHSRRTENGIYGISPCSFIGYQEDTFPQLLKACEKWQAFLGIPPGGKIVAFNSVTSLERCVPISAQFQAVSFYLPLPCLPTAYRSTQGDSKAKYETSRGNMSRGFDRNDPKWIAEEGKGCDEGDMDGWVWNDRDGHDPGVTGHSVYTRAALGVERESPQEEKIPGSNPRFRPSEPPAAIPDKRPEKRKWTLDPIAIATVATGEEHQVTKKARKQRAELS